MATSEQLMSPHLDGLTFRLSQLAIQSNIVEDKTIENCTIIGPNVVYFMDANPKLNNCVIEMEYGDVKDSYFIPTTNEVFNGVIGFKNCLFNNCRFKRIAVIGNPEKIEILKANTPFVE